MPVETHRPEPRAVPRSAGRAAQPSWDGHSIPDLLRQLTSETVDLARLEAELARAEMAHKLDVFRRGVYSMVMGGAVILAALLCALWAANTGLTALLVQVVDLEIAAWLSPLILAVVLGLIGAGMVSAAKSRMEDEGLAPSETRETLEEDARWARHKAREVKREMKEDLRNG